MSTLLRLEPDVAPRTVVFDPPMSDAELERLCFKNGEVQIEGTSEGAIRVNPPAGGLTGDGNAEIIYQLRAWWSTHRRGRVFDSNTGFFFATDLCLAPAQPTSCLSN